MAKYIFKCSACEKIEEKYVPKLVKDITCSCGGQALRQLPNIAQQQVTETVDSYTGAKRDQNHAENMKERRDEHYWNVEVPRLIQTMSTATCLEQGWLVYNDRGELVINKPPSKR